MRVVVALLLGIACLFVQYPLAYAREAEHSGLAVDPIEKSEGYSAVLYDNTSGLPTSEANAIAETNEGFIWIGSYSGLIRYDGKTFERVDSTSGIASVVSLYVDSKGRLWVGTNDNGIGIMEQGDFTMIGKSEGLPSASVRAFAEDEKGNVYVATTQGVAVVDGSLGVRTVEDDRISGQYVRDVREGPDGLTYGVTMSGALFTLRDGTLVDFYDAETLGVFEIISMLPDPKREGYVYVGAGTSTSKIYHGKLGSDLAKGEVIDTDPLSNIKCVELLDNKLWVCADNGIGVATKKTVEIVENVPLDNSIDHVVTDYEGNLWFTSSRQGVMKLVPNQFMDMFDRYELDPAVVNATCKSGEKIYLGTDEGLRVLGPDEVVQSVPIGQAKTASGVRIDATDLIQMMDKHRIRSVIRDREGRLWLATYGEYGLVCYDPGNGDPGDGEAGNGEAGNGEADEQGDEQNLASGSITCFTTAEGMPSDRVRTAYQLSDGSMLVACTGGAVVIRDDEVVKRYDEESGIENTEILTVAETPNGDLLLGTDGGGLYVVGDGGTMHIGTDDGLMSDVVMRIKYDAERSLYWIVTSNSLAYMDAGYRVTTVRNFPYSNNFDLYENTQGEMWVLSSNGIYVVPVDALVENGAIAPVYYGRDNGVPCIATANSYSELTDEGDLYIAGTTGVARVNIEVPFENVNDIKMGVPYVVADGVEIYADEDGTITVPAGVAKVTVHPFVYAYSLMNPRVTYQLEGFEGGQTTVRRSELGPVDYTNLGGGTYNFVMRLSDAQGRGNKVFSVPIIKEKTLSERWWFRVLVGVAILIVVEECVRLRMRRKMRALQQKEEEDRALIRMITVAFAKVIDMKDKYTNGHSLRVAKYTAMLTRELGYDADTVERYYNIALLHDIGKIGVPEEVLNKPGQLTEQEFNIIKSHASLGYRTLKDISIMPELATGAGAHHERPDGRGYPRGLKLDEIPRVAQIIAVADTFDAMYSDRPYRKRMNFDRAVSIIKEVSGTQLTEDVVDAFLRLVKKGEFRDPEDAGGGSTEDIDNIRRKRIEESSGDDGGERARQTSAR